MTTGNWKAHKAEDRAWPGARSLPSLMLPPLQPPRCTPSPINQQGCNSSLFGHRFGNILCSRWQAIKPVAPHTITPHPTFAPVSRSSQSCRVNCYCQLAGPRLSSTCEERGSSSTAKNTQTAGLRQFLVFPATAS